VGPEIGKCIDVDAVACISPGLKTSNAPMSLVAIGVLSVSSCDFRFFTRSSWSQTRPTNSVFTVRSK
jgi:hypothetical protein